MRLPLIERTLDPLYFGRERDTLTPLTQRIVVLTSWERPLPCPQILRDLGDFHVGIEFFELIENGIFVFVSEVII